MRSICYWRNDIKISLAAPAKNTNYETIIYSYSFRMDIRLGVFIAEVARSMASVFLGRNWGQTPPAHNIYCTGSWTRSWPNIRTSTPPSAGAIDMMATGRYRGRDQPPGQQSLLGIAGCFCTLQSNRIRLTPVPRSFRFSDLFRSQRQDQLGLEPADIWPDTPGG